MTRNTEYPEPTRHIRSTVNLLNIHNNRNSIGSHEHHHLHHQRGGDVTLLSRPNKDWYGDAGREEQEAEEETKLKQKEEKMAECQIWGRGDAGATSIEPVFTEEQLRTLAMRVPMNDDDPISPSTTNNNIINNRNNNNRNLPTIQNNTISKNKQRKLNKRRRGNAQRCQGRQERFVVTVNGRPVDTIGAQHPQVERIISSRPNSMNPNNAAFYAATPKKECSVLVQGLAGTATNAVIRRHFSSLCGPIPRVSILKRPISGENSDLAWVSLQSEKAAQDALQLNGSTLLLKKIKVWPKESEQARREVAKMNEESMDMYLPDNGMFGWGPYAEMLVDRRRFKYVREGSGGAGGGPVAMEVQAGVVVKEEGV
jgi:hypothetical protein